MSDNNFVLQNFADAEDSIMMLLGPRPVNFETNPFQILVSPTPVPQPANLNVSNVTPNGKLDYVDVSKYMNLPQRAAAKALGIASSTFRYVSDDKFFQNYLRFENCSKKFSRR